MAVWALLFLRVAKVSHLQHFGALLSHRYYGSSFQSRNRATPKKEQVFVVSLFTFLCCILYVTWKTNITNGDKKARSSFLYKSNSFPENSNPIIVDTFTRNVPTCRKGFGATLSSFPQTWHWHACARVARSLRYTQPHTSLNSNRRRPGRRHTHWVPPVPRHEEIEGQSPASPRGRTEPLHPDVYQRAGRHEESQAHPGWPD